MQTDNIRQETQPQFYSIKELADLLSVHSNTVAMMVKERKITAIKVAGVWRISQIALDNYLESRTVKAKS